MAFRLIQGTTLPIGLDLGTCRIRMAQLRQLEGSLELLAAEEVELPRTSRQDLPTRLAAVGEAVRYMLTSGRFVGRRCILSLPAEATSVQHVRIARVPADQMDGAVAEELAGKLPYPLEEAVIRHLVAGEVSADGGPKQEVIVVAVWRPVLESYLAMASGAKLDVVGVNIEACAVVECFARVMSRASDAIRATLFVDMGAVSTQFVLARGPQIVFARNLAMGGEQIDEALAGKLRTSVQDAALLRGDMAAGRSTPQAEDELFGLLDETIKSIADEMTQCLRYYESVFRHCSVERAIFVGGQAYDKRLCQAIAQRLNLPAQIGDPLVRVKRAPGAGARMNMDWRQPQPAWAVAVGLSLGPTVAA